MSAELAGFLRLAREVLGTFHPEAGGKMAVVIRAETGHRVVLAAPDPQGQPAGALAVAMSPIENRVVRIIREAAGRDVVAKVIAARLGVSNTSGLRAILRNMAERVPPVLEVSSHGYRVVGELATPPAKGVSS